MKTTLWIVGIAAFCGLVFFGLNAYIYHEKQSDVGSSDNLAAYFEERMMTFGVADVGQPIEGFDVGLLMMAYPALETSDFQGVETYEGVYEVRGGEAIFVRRSGEPFTSAAQTVSSEGYATLLENVSARLSFPTYGTADVDALIARIDTGEHITAKIGQEASAFGVTVMPHTLLEDSRCPPNVNCIQAGTVRIRAELSSGLGTGTQVFVLGQPITTEAERVTLVAVSPQAEAGKSIEQSAYVFTFLVEKRTDI